MSTSDVTKAGISELGQSQADRSPDELDPDSFAIDPRSPADLFEQARAQAGMMRFYAHHPDQAGGDFSELFPTTQASTVLASVDGMVPPHLGLLASFFELYQKPKALLNEFTARHMDFQYRRVLGFTPRAAQADHAFLILELKKGAAPVAVTPADAFSAGKDAQGVELIYQPVRSVVVGQAKVEALQSVFRDEQGVYFAPVANSSDGLGGKLDPGQPKWRGFGHNALPRAAVGFAVSSSVLRMREGARSVRVELTLGGLDSAKHTADKLAAALRAYATGPKGWLGPFSVTCELQADVLSLSFSLSVAEPAVVDASPEIHAQAPGAGVPVVHFLVQPDGPLRYADLAGLSVSQLRVRVDVAGVTTLALENDQGSLNPKKAFLPFGSQPVVGSRFMIGCDEALSKQVTDLSVKLCWQAAPANLSDWYVGYHDRAAVSRGIAAKLVYEDRSGQLTSVQQDLMQRVEGFTTLSPRQPATPASGKRQPQADHGLLSLILSGTGIGRSLARRAQLAHPKRARETLPELAARSGFITVALEQDFLHADYRKESVRHAVLQDHIVLNPPYTPTVQGIQLSYSAVSEPVDVSLTGAAGEASLTAGEVQFFHVGCFGYAREHAYLRGQTEFVADKTVRLLPQYPDEGELLIGLSGVGGGDSVSLLLQVAAGSADPALAAQSVRWSVLCDNFWRAFLPQELVLDSTNHFTASGIVALTLPAETTTEQTLMPSGRVWLRAAVQEHSRAACELTTVLANAVEVAFTEQGNAVTHLDQPLPSGRITKLKSQKAAIKSVAQPFASYGGRALEDGAALARRAAERLRHRNRCVTAWDYERMLLEAFPSLHRVQCIPHASEHSWQAPGHVMLVAVADLRNQNAVDALAPCVDLDTLTQMEDYAQRHSGLRVKVHAKNPQYRRVRLDFQVRFLPGMAFNFYRNELEQAVIRALSPWAFDAGLGIQFGNQLYRSVLLNLVEELPYVDFVCEFRMGVEADSSVGFHDVPQLTADAPDVIFVSAAKHTIAPC